MNSPPRIEDLAGRRIGVLGYGREGRSALDALDRRLDGAEVTVLAESGPLPGDRPARRGPLSKLELADFDVLIRSPGVPVAHPALAEFRRRGGAVLNPASLWFGERGDAAVIGVTGSKGKSTTAALLAHVLAESGRRTLLAGNIGVPLLDHLDTPADCVVLELSSYQLADLEGGLAMGLFTRLFPEHLDWHGGEADYVACKLRIADLLAGGPLIVNAADDRLEAATAGIPGRIAANRPPAACRVDSRLERARERVLEAGDWPLLGAHNLDNAAVVVEAACRLGLTIAGIASALGRFRPLAHRLEVVAGQHGITWVNDAIATSPHATLAALQALTGRPVILLAGGQPRPADWQPVTDFCRTHPLHALITLPDNGSAIAAGFRSSGDRLAGRIESAENLEAAVRRAAALATDGCVVLLSPGAPSFPHFRDFEDRGECFAAAVKSLAGD